MCSIHAFFCLLQPLIGDFRSNYVSSGSLPVTWSHVTSFPVWWLPPPASYCLVGREMYSIPEFLACYSLFQLNSGQMTSLAGCFRSPEVPWQHFLSRDCLLLRATAFWEVKCTVYAYFWPCTGMLRWFPVQLRHFRVTSGHLWSCDVISCHVTAYSCELQPCRKWDVRYSEFLAFYSHFQLTSGKMTSLTGHLRSPEVMWHHFLPRDCLLLATALNKVKSTVYGRFWPSTATSWWHPVKLRHFRSLEVWSRHFQSRDWLLLPATAF